MTAKKLTAAQRKQAEKIVKAIKRDEAYITRSEFTARCDAFYFGDDYATQGPVYREVERMIGEWMDFSRAAYGKLCEDAQRVSDEESKARGEYVYLFDDGIDHENVTDGTDWTGHKMTEDSIGYWNRMIGSGCNAIGERAGQYGIDINARLGRIIF